VWTAQRHQGGGRRPGHSRVAVHTQRQGEHSTAQQKLAKIISKQQAVKD
jgi:hypothetical protein